MHLIERADRPLNRAACALYDLRDRRRILAERLSRALDPIAFAAWDLTGWAEPRIRQLESDDLVLNLIRAAIRRVRAFRRALAAIPWEES